MKLILFCLCFPFLAATQTIHVEGNEIVYKGTIRRSGSSHRIQPAVLTAAKGGVVQTRALSGQQSVTARSVLSMKRPFPLIRDLHFRLQVRAQKDGYSYRIDSVYITEKQHANDTIKRTGTEELLEGRELTGAAGTDHEKLLNEIDMYLQKFIAILRRELQ